MMRWHWLDCLLYLLLLGLLCFPAGRILALIPFDPESYPFRSLPFERNGKIYDAIHIRSWQKRAPDVSKLVPGIVPKKAVEGKPDAGTMDRMLRETCVAELTHWLLCVAGIALFWLWPGMGGVVFYSLCHPGQSALYPHSAVSSPPPASDKSDSGKTRKKDSSCGY